MTDETITVSDSALPGAVAAAFRQLALGIGAWAIGRGYIGTDTLNSIITVGLVVLPVAYGQWRQYQNHQKARKLAVMSPIGAVK